MVEVILVFIFGLIIGSFLNCAIYRSYKGESFVKGRSYCPYCHHELRAVDLVPLLSFIGLKGKCRYCRAPISWQYPLVELSTALLFVFAYLRFYPDAVSVAFWWTMFSVLTFIFVFDSRYCLIPDEATYSGIAIAAVGLAYSFLFGAIGSAEIWSAVVASLGAAAFIFALWFFSKGRAMGFGDVKLVLLLGLLSGCPKVLVGLFLSFLLGAIIGLALVGLKKKGMKSEIPFGPFLIIGTMIAFFWGDRIISWYFSLKF